MSKIENKKRVQEYEYFTHGFRGNAKPLYEVMNDLAKDGFETFQVDFMGCNLMLRRKIL